MSPGSVTKVVPKVVPEEENPFIFGRLIFIHLQCWEVLPFLTIQLQRCIKFMVLRAQEFYTPLALNCPKKQHLPALEVYKISLPILAVEFDLQETLITPLNPHFGHALWAAS